MTKNYNNMTGLILYSGNPYAIKKIHEQLEMQDMDTQRREIILTKYYYTRLSEVQKRMYKSIARNKLRVQLTTPIRRQQKKCDSFGRPVYYACDEKNNVVIVSEYGNLTIEPFVAPDGEKNVDVPVAPFSTDRETCLLFYWLCTSVFEGKLNFEKLKKIQAQEDLYNQLLDLYKDD